MIRHIVWDWNGTLLGDSAALISATISAFRLCGLPPITRADYQRHHIQPIPVFYERLAGRALSAVEQERLDACFRSAYAADQVPLTVDAVAALTSWARTSGRQSLLSMYPHRGLVPLVTAAGIAHFFTAVDGTVDPAVSRKAPHLAAHLAKQAIAPESVLLVGDSLDDLWAAREVGVRCVIYHAGVDSLHSRAHFEGAGVPLVPTLQAAVELAAAL